MKKFITAVVITLLLSCMLTYANGSGATSGGNTEVQGEFKSWSEHVYYNATDLTVAEGNTLRITCILTVFDQLKWMHNGTQIYFSHGSVNSFSVVEVLEPHGFITSVLTIKNAQRKHSGEYKCTSFSPLFVSVSVLHADEHGSNSCQLLNLSSSQRCLGLSASSAGDTNNTKVLREKYPITLECQIIKKKDEKVQLKWFKDEMEIIPDDDHYKINQENGTLFIAAASKEDVGLYKCQTVNYSPAQSFNISIIFLTYKKMPKSVTVLKGERLTLACDVEGDPVPIVTWLKDNENVDEVVNASHFSLEESEGKVPNATLIIPTVEYEDRAQYLCKIASAGVRFNSTTLVRVKDMYAALWPFLGICAEVIILCLIIFVYEKRRLKADFEESDTDQPVEQKNKSDNNKDVRQRK